LGEIGTLTSLGQQPLIINFNCYFSLQPAGGKHGIE
jgi:hypothetical protein